MAWRWMMDCAGNGFNFYCIFSKEQITLPSHPVLSLCCLNSLPFTSINSFGKVQLCCKRTAEWYGMLMCSVLVHVFFKAYFVYHITENR